MGSTGTGTFSDYSRKGPSNPEKNNGGASGEDRCAIAFSTSLEEISRCFYFLTNNDVPPTNTELIVIFNGIRLAVETLKGEELGYLPTKFNYLKFCMDDGYHYSGAITSSSNSSTPKIVVDIVPIHE